LGPAEDGLARAAEVGAIALPERESESKPAVVGLGLEGEKALEPSPRASGEVPNSGDEMSQPPVSASGAMETPEALSGNPVPTEDVLAPPATSGTKPQRSATSLDSQAPPLALPVELASVTVRPGETTMALVRRIKPPEVSSEQALLALYRLNVRAFDGNIHRLPAGTVLQVPTVDQMTAIPAARAREELRSFKDGGGVVANHRDQLRLSQGGKGGSKADEGVSGGASGGASAPEGEVKRVAINAAMAEVQSRIKQLESIVASLNVLVSARESQVAKVQAEIAAMGGVVAEPAVSNSESGSAPISESHPSEPPVEENVLSELPAKPSAAGVSLGSASATLLRSSTREEAALQAALAAEEVTVPAWVKILAGVAAMSLGLAVFLPFVLMRRRAAAAGLVSDDEDEQLA